ncbi:hypothetical protein AALP_AA1G107800 [Arabis alpina]|uniref:F-box domain-containing protein n=1 Tax=Arabis alpina TaxID=50452 RepID=A0A087HMF8_ARAAL|nr:hypothetical protein AALP_AA1G107800 [Arabis alpina]
MDRLKEEEEDGKLLEFIPLDLIPDILLRLPAKSAVRFRCVSKLWLSITTRPEFIRSFSIQSRRRLMVCTKTADDKRSFISLPPNLNTPESHVIDCYMINSPSSDCDGYHNHTPFSESVQGLVCYGDSYKIVVWNPSMRQHVTLPQPEPRAHWVRSCLGYDPVEGKYKVLYISGKRAKDPLVFTLGPQETWRLTHDCPVHVPKNIKERIGVCVNGHVYYEAKIRFGDSVEDLLMSFDVRYEKFNTIKKPADPTLSRLMVNYLGKLAWVCYSTTSLRFWVLEDVERQEWSLRDFLVPFPMFLQCDPVWDVALYMRGVTHDTGEFIYTTTIHEIFYVLYYDPTRERTRRNKYEASGDEESGDKDFWIGNGINLYNTDNIHWFPNHSESLMSLENGPCFVPDISSSDSE